MSKLQKTAGVIAAIFTIVPFLIAAVKDTFFNRGCMDSFAVVWISTALIWFIGGPSAISRLFLAGEKSKLSQPKTMIWKAIDALSIFGLIIVVWVTAFIFSGTSPYNLHYIFGGR